MPHLLLPAWIDESPRTSARTVDPIDSFDFKDEPEANGLLLPAVQQAREAARRTTSDDEDPIDALIAETEDDAILIGLLLPAVQKVHEVDSKPDPIDDFAEPAGVEPTPFVLVELLVVI